MDDKIKTMKKLKINFEKVSKILPLVYLKLNILTIKYINKNYLSCLRLACSCWSCCLCRSKASRPWAVLANLSLTPEALTPIGLNDLGCSSW